MRRATLLTLFVSVKERLLRAFRSDDAGELDLVETPSFKEGPMFSLISGLSKLQPFCGKRLFANVTLQKIIRTGAFTLKGDGGLIASSDFINLVGHVGATHTIPVTPGMSLVMVGALSAASMTSEKQATELINEQVIKYGLVELAFDSGLDFRSCWLNMNDADGKMVCGSDRISELAAALATLPAQVVQDHEGQRAMSIIRNYPRFIIMSLSEGRALFAGALPNISSGFTELVRKHGRMYSSNLVPICAIVPGFDGADWLLMREVEILGARPIAFEGSTYVDLKGPRYVGRRGKIVIDGTFWGREFHKNKDRGFVAKFPTGLIVSNCEGREVAFSMEKDAELLEALAITDYSLLARFYEADSNSTQQFKTHQGARFPIILNVVRPFRFRIALGIVDYGLRWTIQKVPEKYRQRWMTMWPHYFQLSDLSLQEYRSELFAKRMRGLEVGKVVALTGLMWNDAKKWDKTYNKAVIPQVSASNSTCEWAYNVLPGELGRVESDAEDGCLVRWDKYEGELFWVAPQNLMPVPD